MNLAPKITLIGILTVGVIMGVTGYFVVSNIRTDMSESLSNRLAGDASFAKSRVAQNVKHIASITRVISKIRDIPRALNLYENRGINQLLNDQIEIYPFINFILVIENDGSIFSVSTRDSQGKKNQGEQLLSRTVRDHPMFPAENTELVRQGNVGIDPFLSVIGISRTFSQWFASDVIKRGHVIGQVVISVDWSKQYAELAEGIVNELLATNNPIKGVSISNKQGEAYVQREVQQSLGSDVMNFGENTDLVASQTILFGHEPYNINIVYDKRKALEPIVEATRFISFATLFASVVLGLIFFLTLRKLILSRVRTLHHSMQRIGHGDLSFKVPPLGDDEVGELGASINLMVENLSSKTISVERLNEAFSLLETILESTDNGILVTDNDGKIIKANQRFGVLWNVPEKLKSYADLLALSAHFTSKLLDPEQLILSNASHQAKGGEEFVDVLNFVDGRVLERVSRPMLQNDVIVGRVWSYRDVTNRVRYERALVEAKEKSEDAVRAKSQFLASMSHEIRTPMNGVLGMLSILKGSELGDSQQRQVKLAQSSAQALLSLINDILDFSKIEAGKLDIENVDFNLLQLFGDFSESFALRVLEKGIELIVDTSQVRQTMVEGDPGRLRQVLNNVVGNALKFTEKGEIVVSVVLDECGVKGDDRELMLQCTVKDTGIGISTDKQTELFESFTQADSSTTRRYGGTGLGLSISKQLCELMGGDIRVSSELGEGSSFVFSLRLKSSDFAAPTLPDVDIDQIKILIVDDNSTSLEVLQSQLEVWGAQVTAVSNAVHALKELQAATSGEGKEAFDLAILDMQMPEIDGAELGQRIRADQRLDQLKLMMMTSMSHRGDAKYFASLGFQGYFPKPVTAEDLYGALTVVFEGGDALEHAQPLVTSHYLHSLSRSETSMSELESERRDIPVDGRILLVEDNVINQEVAKIMLENLGFTVDIAGNGLEALQQLKAMADEAPYQLVLMDCQMPEMDGYAATREIRLGHVDSKTKDIPIIAMTANAMKGDREECLQAGMDDYISKPVDPVKLETALTQWLVHKSL